MQHSNLAERCHGRWRSILLALGFDKVFLTGKHCACPMCGGKDRFRFDDKDGEGSWICNQCGSAKGIRLVMDTKRIEFKAAARLIENALENSMVDAPKRDFDPDQLAKAMKQLSARAKPVSVDDPVWRYLASRLGQIAVPSCIRTVDSCIYKDAGERSLNYHPAMIASIRDLEGHAVALHRTYLTADGSKAQVASPRKVLGTMPDGCAIRLAEPAETMGVAEGIETALSAAELFGMPVWSTINAGRLRVWTPPAIVKKVVIFGDNDTNCAGHVAAYALAGRLRAADIDAFVEIPPTIGTDWNDVLRNQRRAA